MGVDHVLFAVAGLREPSLAYETSERLTPCVLPKVVLDVARLIEHLTTSIYLTCILHSQASRMRVLHVRHLNPLARNPFEAFFL